MQVRILSPRQTVRYVRKVWLVDTKENVRQTLAETADSAIVDAATLLTALAALATLTEQNIGLQRQIDGLTEALSASEARSKELTDAKFVTFRTLIDTQGERVKLALDATEKAIDKAEVATQKAIEKESENNNDRFAKVNEFRAQQTELIARFATLERVDLLYSQTRQRMDEISSHLDGRITDLAFRITKIEEFARGAQGSRTGLYAAIGAAVGVLTIIVFVANALTN